MPSLGCAHCFIAVFIIPTVHSCSKFMFWAGAGKRGQGRVGKRGEDSYTWPLSSLLGSCGSLVSLALSHESIPGEYSHGYIYIARTGNLISLFLNLDYEDQLNPCFLPDLSWGLWLYSNGSEFSPFVPFFLAWALCLSWPSLTPPPSQSVVFP